MFTDALAPNGNKLVVGGSELSIGLKDGQEYWFFSKRLELRNNFAVDGGMFGTIFNVNAEILADLNDVTVPDGGSATTNYIAKTGKRGINRNKNIPVEDTTNIFRATTK